jgi:hypothetical protein
VTASPGSSDPTKRAGGATSRTRQLVGVSESSVTTATRQPAPWKFQPGVPFGFVVTRSRKTTSARSIWTASAGQYQYAPCSGKKEEAWRPRLRQ